MSEWKQICAVNDIPHLGSRVVRHLEAGVAIDIAIFRNEAKVFALRDHCPHKGGPLSQGIVHGDQVTCPLHGWKLRLETGEAVAPDEGCVRRYPVKVEGDLVFLQL